MNRKSLAMAAFLFVSVAALQINTLQLHHRIDILSPALFNPSPDGLEKGRSQLYDSQLVDPFLQSKGHNS
jgi:hypothetical protein